MSHVAADVRPARCSAGAPAGAEGIGVRVSGVIIIGCIS